MSIWYALLKALDRTPFDVIRNAAAFLLCEGAKQCEHQLPVLRKRVDVFLLKADGNAELLQVPDSFQKVNRVSGKTGNGLCENDIDFTRFAIVEHMLELIAFGCSGTADAIIRINTDILPIGVLLNKLAVIADLRRQGMLQPLGLH